VKHPKIMELARSTPWAITPQKFTAIMELLTLRASGARFTAEEIAARIGAGPAQRTESRSGTVGVLPIYGALTPRADLMTEMSGGSSVQRLSDSFRGMLADESIGAILLDVDSPGGMTDLIPEFAAEIRDARGAKPIVAIANTDAASAAYWLASQADEFVVTPSGMVGSIGVFAAHQDVSAMMEQDGIKTTLVAAGKYKVESNPYEPLSDEARAAIQERVDTFYGLFIDDVAQGRGVASSVVRAGFGEGRIVTAAAAVKLGMVDRVDTFEATIERMIVQAATPSRARVAARAANNHTNVAAEKPDPPGDPADNKINLEAATSGLSFAAAAAALSEQAERLTIDVTSLADVRRGRLTAPKREALHVVVDSLRGSTATLERVLADTDPANRPLRDEERVYLHSIRSTNQ